MTLAKFREDLFDEDLYPSLQNIRGYTLINLHMWFDREKEYESFQPEVWNDREFNLLICDPKDGEIYYGQSIDWNFKRQ